MATSILVPVDGSHASNAAANLALRQWERMNNAAFCELFGSCTRGILSGLQTALLTYHRAALTKRVDRQNRSGL